MTVDIAKVSAILREVAAEEVMPRFRALAEHEIRAKNGGEVVTVADVAAGLDILAQDGAVLRLFYDGHFGDDTTQHSGGVRVSLKY